MPARSFREDFPAVPESLDALQDRLAAAWTDLGADVTDHDRLRFEMAVVEIVANIVEHAGLTDTRPPVRMITCVVTVDDEEVRAEFADDGRPAAIDLSAVFMPGEDAESGRGLALAVAAVDDLRYEREDGINRWTVVCVRS